MTVGPEPRLIRTRATMHLMCVTEGALASYMLHVGTYRSKHDKDLNRTTENTVTTQKVINLLEEILNPWFVRRGCCITMDSAYMGEPLAMVVTEAWKMNVLSTSSQIHAALIQKRLHQNAKR